MEQEHQEEFDSVNYPEHYVDSECDIQCIEVTQHMNFCVGNAMKYLWRYKKKGSPLEDLEKAAWYIQQEIRRLEAGHKL